MTETYHIPRTHGWASFCVQADKIYSICEFMNLFKCILETTGRNGHKEVTAAKITPDEEQKMHLCFASFCCSAQ